MYPSSISDIDELVLRCRNPKARSYLAEAVACTKAGSFRAAIVVTWVAVVHDLIAKFEQLALAGDKKAREQTDHFSDIVRRQDVAASLAYERSILDVARDAFELIGGIAHSDLLRLRDDRNRCAHPSMFDPDSDYQPAPELARCHIVNAVTHLLQHGPAQGVAALERLLGELMQPYFPSKVEDLIIHLAHGPLGNPRDSLVRNYVVVLLKKLLTNVEEVPIDLLAKIRFETERVQKKARVLITLQAAMKMHRQLCLEVMREKLDELAGRTSDERLSALIELCACVPELWGMLSPAQQNRSTRYIEALPTQDVEHVLCAGWAIAALRGTAQKRLESAGPGDWTALSRCTNPPADFIGIALSHLMKAKSWNAANSPAEFLVAFLELVSEDQVLSLIGQLNVNEELKGSFGVHAVFRKLAQDPRFGAMKLCTLISAQNAQTTFEREAWWPY